MQIIVWRDKHSTKYYDASTVEAWDASCIEILKELTDEDYGYMQPAMWEPYIPEDTQRLANTNLEGLSAEVLELIEKKVLKARSQVETENRVSARAKEQYDLALSYIAADGSPTLSYGNGRRFEPAAWRIIADRNGYEYEDFSLEDVFTKDDDDE